MPCKYRHGVTRKKRETPPVAPIATGDTEARIIALACGEPPKGFSRWTLRLLEEKIVELGIVDHISDNTIGRLLKKHR
ncbi:MAG: helix-turn-helix domain-containing protein, partial [Azoarcus sp.]|nr:helix-turn-helix domain-containing protein [Azoarcus sp.]